RPDGVGDRPRGALPLGEQLEDPTPDGVAEDVERVHAAGMPDPTYISTDRSGLAGAPAGRGCRGRPSGGPVTPGPRACGHHQTLSARADDRDLVRVDLEVRALAGELLGPVRGGHTGLAGEVAAVRDDRAVQVEQLTGNDRD